MTLELLLTLAVVQGLTEFLPVSSSGHLVLLETLFGLKDAESNLALNIYLHFASALAVIVYYRRDLWRIAVEKRSWLLPLLLATIPAGLVGMLLEDVVERLFSDPVAVAFGWIATGTALWWGQRVGAQDREIDALGPRRATAIGLAQAAAILPGLSRSGMTISASLLAGLRPDEATRFAFLMAIPVILGASALKLPRLFEQGENPATPLAIAGVVCFAVSYAALAALVRVVRARRLQPFAWYCWALAAGVLVWRVSGA